MENKFGQKIKKIRKDRGLTQQEFAESLGYAHKSTINKIESGQEDMSYQKILVLLKEYMLDAKDLFDNSEKEIERIDELIEESKKLKHDSCIIYIHGLYGNSGESDFYSFYTNKYDVIGLDYKDGNPWEVKDKIIHEFSEISKRYKNVYVIANSIGAFYTYMYLSEFNIKKAFFISPLINMKEVIEGLMKQYNISSDALKTRKIINLDNGQTLSYDFYESLKEKDNWDIKTYVLYGEKDKLIDQKTIFNFISSHNSSLTIMKNGEHYFHTPGQLKFIKKWINDIL
ncbi:MAG: helix-turn-helix domain-containing protein [Bacilli bacterium]|nr:helix-turn-helix domain-containing protein [Bacilli bacterium]